MNEGTLLIGDAAEQLREMVSDACVQTVVTSPPYFRQRDYGQPGQVGQERTVSEYADRLVQVFREVRRVLRDDGTVWLNLDDTYLDGELAGVPWHTALAMKADGWHLRCDVIWEKPNALPSSVTNRPTRSHEYVFLFTKAKGYRYEQLREPWTGTRPDDLRRAREGHAGYQGKHASGTQAAGFRGQPKGDPDKGRNKRSVWKLSAGRYAGAHFAVMPEALAELCILAGSRPDDLVLDPFAGAGTTLAVARRLGRKYLGVELNAEYEPLIRERLDVAHALPLFRD